MAKLTSDDWKIIRDLEAEAGRVILNSKMVKFGEALGEPFKVPVCCLAGTKGFDRLIEIKEEILRMQRGR